MVSSGANIPGSLPRAVGRWWAVGIVFLCWTLVVLYLLRERLHVPLLLATLITAEVGTCLRFLVNDRWVFGHRRPSLKRLVQYHVANAGSFVVWWTVSNLLPVLGLHYLLASIAATACSVGLSMATNFLWIWRRRWAGPRQAGSRPE